MIRWYSTGLTAFRIVVTGAVCGLFSHAACAADTGAAPFELPEITVISTTPVGGTGIAEEKYPGNVQIINQKDLPQNAQSLPEVLDQLVGSVNVNSTQGNPSVVDQIGRAHV